MTNIASIIETRIINNIDLGILGIEKRLWK
jgi:hypothetical protein